MAEIARIEEVRQLLPETAAKITQLVVDNPGQFGLVLAGDIVATRILMNLVKPRTPLEALALFTVLTAGLPMLGALAVRKGWLRFRVRDEDGNLIPLLEEPGCPEGETVREHYAHGGRLGDKGR